MFPLQGIKFLCESVAIKATCYKVKTSRAHSWAPFKVQFFFFAQGLIWEAFQIRWWSLLKQYFML